MMTIALNKVGNVFMVVNSSIVHDKHTSRARIWSCQGKLDIVSSFNEPGMEKCIRDSFADN